MHLKKKKKNLDTIGVSNNIYTIKLNKDVIVIHNMIIKTWSLPYKFSF